MFPDHGGRKDRQGDLVDQVNLAGRSGHNCRLRLTEFLG